MTYIPTILTNRLASDAVTSAKILDNEIVNADVAAGAAIVYSKLNLANSIVNADIAAGAAIVYSKLSLANSIVNADVAAGAALAVTKLALGGANTVLQSDGATNSFSTTTGANARLAVSKNSGATVGTRRRVNFVEGSGITLTIADDAGNEEVDVTIAAVGAASGPVDTAVTTKTANYTVVLTTDHTIFVDTTTNAVTITLPASHNAGEEVVVKDVGANVATNGITVATADTDTIDGNAANFTFGQNYESFTYKSDGTNWWII